MDGRRPPRRLSTLDRPDVNGARQVNILEPLLQLLSPQPVLLMLAALEVEQSSMSPQLDRAPERGAQQRRPGVTCAVSGGVCSAWTSSMLDANCVRAGVMLACGHGHTRSTH